MQKRIKSSHLLCFRIVMYTGGMNTPLMLARRSETQLHLKTDWKGIAATPCAQHSPSLLYWSLLSCSDCQGMVFPSEQQELFPSEQNSMFCAMSMLWKVDPKGSLNFSKPGCLREWPQLLSVMVSTEEGSSSDMEQLFSSWEPWLRKERL